MLNSIIMRTEGCDTNLSDLHGPYIRARLSADSVLYLGAHAAGGATRQSDRSHRCNPVRSRRSLPPWLMCGAAQSERVYFPTQGWVSRPHEEDSPSRFVSVVMALTLNRGPLAHIRLSLFSILILRIILLWMLCLIVWESRYIAVILTAYKKIIAVKYVKNKEKCKVSWSWLQNEVYFVIITSWLYVILLITAFF